MPSSDRIYKGPYSVMYCAHRCGHRIEGGPHERANWAYCILCQAPTCKRWWCMERCPHALGGANMHKYDRYRVKDAVEDAICSAIGIGGLADLKTYEVGGIKLGVPD